MGQGFCTLNACGDIDTQNYSTMESRQKTRTEYTDSDVQKLAQQDFMEVSQSDENNNGRNRLESEAIPYLDEPIEAVIPYTTTDDYNTTPEPTSLMAISEDTSHDDEKTYSHHQKNKSTKLGEEMKMQQLRMKYSSRRIILPKKDEQKTPKCFDCGGFYHIQNDPLNAYDGVGIVCELCGENRDENPEMLLQEYYYKCEDCENVDICTKCYEKEKTKLKNKNKDDDDR
eukprot:191012_1